jgi:outer membrane protein
MEDRFAKDGAIMSEAERKKLERDIVSARRDLKRDQDEFREDVNFRFNEERAKIQKEVFDAIVKVAKDQGYDLVLFDGVAFASPKVDISDSVITYLKDKKQQGQ